MAGMRWLNLTRITPYIEKLITPLTANTISDSKVSLDIGYRFGNVKNVIAA